MTSILQMIDDRERYLLSRIEELEGENKQLRKEISDGLTREIAHGEAMLCNLVIALIDKEKKP